LAKNAELSPASMTAMLDQLEEWGYVARRRSAEDRRQVLVTLTDKGREKMEAKRVAWSSTFLAALGQHSDEELETAVRVMRTVGGFLDTLGRD
jgi:DNA-binding MarR family transcriptional regulator